MNTTDLKSKIHREIDILEDPSVLEGIYRFLELNSETDDIYHVSEELRDKLLRSEEQIYKGGFITHEDLNVKIDEWLSR